MGRLWRCAWMAAFGCSTLAVHARADEAVLFNVPKAPSLAGDELAACSDWGMPITGLVGPSVWEARRTRPAASFRLAWDAQDLIILADVSDPTPSEADALNTLYTKDSLELFLALAERPDYRFQLVIAPGRTAASSEVRVNVVDHRGEDLPDIRHTVTRSARDGGYRLLIRVPVANLGVAARAGQRLLLQLIVNDADASGDRQRFAWYPSGETWRDTKAMYRLRLASRSDDRSEVGAVGGYRAFRGTQVWVQTPEKLSGRLVELQQDGETLGVACIRRDEGRGRGMAMVRMPIIGERKTVEPMTVVVDGEPVATAAFPEMPDAEESITSAGFGPETCIFWTDRFPECDFASPADVEDLIGTYTVKTAYYDADLNPVSTATKPGRYAAVSRITCPGGKAYTRYSMLYRTPAKPDLGWASRFEMQVKLPDEFGINPAVMARESGTLAGEFTGAFRSNLGRSDNWASVLATLAEMTPDQPRMVLRTSPNSISGDYLARLQVKLEDYRYPCFISLPKDHEAASGRAYPVILYLHGSGERGRDLKSVKKNLVAKFAREHDLPFIVVAPQCPPRAWWNTVHLDRTLNEIAQQYRVDPRRIYVTGLSMGGYGTWNLAMAYPQRFAAIAPICGAGDPDDMARIKDLPTWAFHGDKDDSVPLAEDAKGIEALQKLHGRVRFTVYPGVGHDSWTQTYKNPEIYTWLQQQMLGEPQEPFVP